MARSHPYFPKEAIIKNYLPNTIPVTHILAIFFGSCLVVILTCIIIFRLNKRQISSSDKWTAIWFAICGCIHCVLEGFYVVNVKTIASNATLLAQLWKEYSHSDSRYLTVNETVWSIEAVTAFLEGPACFFAFYAIIAAKPYRHAFQLLISAGQLYGCVLYYATSILVDHKYSNPHPYYFWGYFVLMNAPWIVVPLMLCKSSVQAMNKAFAVTKQYKNK